MSLSPSKHTSQPEVALRPASPESTIDAHSDHNQQTIIHTSRTEFDVNAPPPEGGLRAWSTVAAAFLCAFMTFGTVNMWGIFQDAYQTPDSRFSSVSLFDLGFVGGCSMGFGFGIGPLANVLVRKWGVRAPVFVGFVVMAVAMELASIAKEFWELLLSQGILFGIGASLAYIPAIGLPSQYFVKRRALATGISASGSGIGAVVLSPIAQAAITHLGIPWACRIIGFMCIALGGLALVLMHPRTPHVQSKTATTIEDTNEKPAQVQYRTFDLSIVMISGYPWWLAFVFIQCFGYVVPTFYIPGYCTSIGISHSTTAGVLSVTSATNAIGRIIAGQLADRVGTFNVLISFTFLSGVMCLAIWLPAETVGTMMVFAVIWGFFSSAYWCLSVPATVRIVGIERLGSAVSLQFMMNLIPPIFSSPIGARILSVTFGSSVDGGTVVPRSSYRWLIVFSALTSIVAALLLLPARLGMHRKVWAKV